MITPVRALMRCLLLVALLGLLTALAACGQRAAILAANGQAGRPTQSASSDLPAMIMVTLTDSEFPKSNMAVTHGDQVMLMILNRSTAPQTVTSEMPIRAEQVQNVSADTAPVSTPSAPALTVTVPAGDEVDVSFVPARSGHFAFSYGKTAMGEMSVN